MGLNIFFVEVCVESDQDVEQEKGRSRSREQGTEDADVLPSLAIAWT